MRPTFRQSTVAILRKDLLVEMRTMESVPAMVLLAVSTLVVFHFALDRDSLSGGLASGVFWVTLLFAAILGINRLFVTEFENSGMQGILLSPTDRGAIYFAKGLALLIFLLALEVIAVPVFALFFLEGSFTEILVRLIPILALANLGIAAVGTLAAAMTVYARARELILPIVMLPLMVPLVIAASAATKPVMNMSDIGSPPGKWLLVLGLFDTVFALLAFVVFDFLLEE